LLVSISPVRRNWLLAVIGLLLLWFAWSIRPVLNPLIAGYFLAFVLHPFVLRLQKHGWSRARAVNTIFLTAAVLGVGVSLAIGVQAVQYSQEIATVEWRDRQIAKIDSFLAEHEEGVRWLSDAAGLTMEEEIPSARGIVAELHEEYVERVEEDPEGQGAVVRSVGQPLWRIFGSVMALVSFIVLLPIYAYFLLFELERIHGFLRRYLPKRHREHVSRVGGQIGEVISSFFRGRLTVCLIKGATISLGLALLGVKYSLLVGMASGFLALVPFAGPMLGFLTAFVLALQQSAEGRFVEMELFGALWRTGLVYGLAEVLEGYYLVPKILGTSLGLHPVVVLLSIFAGAAAFGMFGALLALPVTSALVILFREFVLPALARFADEDG